MGLDPLSETETIRWIKSTANDLNNILQVITESSQMIEAFCRNQPGAEVYLKMLRSGVERATHVTRQIAERVGPAPTDQIAPQSEAAAPAQAPIFPPERIPQPQSAPAQEPIEIHNPTGERELVLVVDDEDFVTQLAARVLADAGYQVVTAKNGFQALDIYRQLTDRISLVILDFTMPVMDGADVFAELQKINPQVAVVLSSGFAEQEPLRAMLARGLRGFIPKPYTQQKLLSQIRQTLDGI